MLPPLPLPHTKHTIQVTHTLTHGLHTRKRSFQEQTPEQPETALKIK